MLTLAAQLVPHAVDPCPDAMVVVDVGHSYTHAVPMVQGTAQWDAAQRYATILMPGWTWAARS